MNTLQQHLNDAYGIVAFSDDEYWNWGGKKLFDAIGEDGVRRFEKIRKPMQGGRATPSERIAFYDFAANPEIASVVHSMKADAIRASGEAVLQRIHDAINVLDFGCNNGFLTTWYAISKPESTITGIDLSSSCIQSARKKAMQIQISNVNFIAGDPRRELRKATYDAIVDTQSVMEANDRKTLLSWIAKSLTDGGRFVSVPQAATRDIFIRYFNDINNSGLVVTDVGYVRFSDLGGSGGYGVFQA